MVGGALGDLLSLSARRPVTAPPRIRPRWRRALRALGPAAPAAAPLEPLRAGLGALVALGLVGLLVLSPAVDLELGLYLIAPFGASAVLLFAVPNSPLAQPWPAVVGNVLAALIGVGVVKLVADPALRVALAVGLTLVVLGFARALHPPAGAVAMTAALSPEAAQALGFGFALAPVGLGTVLLVAMAAAYARLTGRRYPFRQFEEAGPHRTADPPAVERLGLSEAELTDLLQRYRQSLNLGVEDLARLIGAAEMQAAGHWAGPLTAADVMSRDLVTVGPAAPLSEVAQLFDRHGFTSLPVVDGQGRFLGLIFQLHLIRRAGAPARGSRAPFGAAMAWLRARGGGGATGEGDRAGDVMATDGPWVAPEASVGELLALLAEQERDAVPVLAEDRTLAGLVTQTDLIAALAREGLRGAERREDSGP